MSDSLRCPECGYTKEDAMIHWDHYLCKGKIPTLKPETITLKSLFTAFAVDIEKVANEALGPRVDTRVCVPPEVIEYWLQHIEMIMEVDIKKLLGRENNAIQPR